MQGIFDEIFEVSGKRNKVEEYCSSLAAHGIEHMVMSYWAWTRNTVEETFWRHTAKAAFSLTVSLESSTSYVGKETMSSVLRSLRGGLRIVVDDIRR